MRRECEFCGTEFVAQRSTARFCSSSCRARMSQGETPTRVTELKPRDSVVSDLVASVRLRVEAAGLEETPDGVRAILLAELMTKNDDGSKFAALDRQLTVALDRLDRLAPAPGRVDELRLRRDRKRAAGA